MAPSPRSLEEEEAGKLFKLRRGISQSSKINANLIKTKSKIKVNEC